MSPPVWFHAAELISVALILLAGIYVLLGLQAQKYRANPSARLFAVLILAMGLWSLGYGFEIAAASLSHKIVWAKIQYAGIVTVAPLWLAFALTYTGHSALLTRRRRMLLSLIPLVTLLLVWTNEHHRWIWQATDLVFCGGLSFLTHSYGWAFWVHALYSYCLLLAGSAAFLRGALEAARIFRAQALAALFAALIPLAGNIVYVFGLLPLCGIDPTPFFFLPSGIVLSWAFTRYRLLDLFPPAQSAILNSLTDSILLLDRQRRVLFMNEAAERIFGKRADECLGQPAERVCPHGDRIVPLLEETQNRQPHVMSIGSGARQFEIHVLLMPMFGGRHPPEHVSHLVVLRDVTERRRAEEALRRRDAILRAVDLVAEKFLSLAWEESVPQALAELGRAAGVSRVYIFERHLSEGGVPLVSQRFEWAAPGITPQIDNPDLQNLAWIEAGFERWERAFQDGQSISGRVRDFPPSERDLLSAQQILSIVVIPIFAEKKIWGFIGFDECLAERHWSKVELDALSAAASILGAAIERREMEARLLERQRAQNLLHEIIRAALQEDDMQSVAQVLVNRLGELIHADYCFLTRWDKARQQTIPFASFGFPTEQYRTMHGQPGEKNFTRSVLEAGHPLVAEDVLNSPYVSQRVAKLFNVRSALAVPMIARDKKLGAVLLGFSQPHHFTAEEIGISEQAAELIALAFARSEALEEARRRAEEADTLRRAGAAISETLDLHEAAIRILEHLAFVLPHDSASIQLLREGELEIVGGDGWEDPLRVIGLRFPIPSETPNSVVIQTRRPYLLHEADKAYPAFRQPPHDHIRSWLGVPLLVRNEIIGLLAIDGRDPFQFTHEDVELVNAFAAQVAVVLENARMFETIQQLATTDDLTGLYNRRHFMELAQREFERARRYKRNLAAMIFDIDHFKRVNDAYGHPVGDEVLSAIGCLCREKLREADPIGRYGGEEFAALMVETQLDDAKRAAERLRGEVENMIVRTQAGEIKVTISIGLAQLDDNSPNLETLLARADQAMYIAKNKGRNRVVTLR